MGYWEHNAGVPTSGWDHEGVVECDEDDSITCEWCERQEVRFIHTVSHVSWSRSLDVGCI